MKTSETKILPNLQNNTITAIVGQIGRSTILFFNHILFLFAFTYRLLSLFFTKKKNGQKLVRKAIVEQIYFTAVQALPVIIPISLIIGTMLIIIFTKLTGQFDLGKTIITLLIRELGPLITALIVILRSATAVTIEISYMSILNETEALEMAGIDPMRLICLPRFLGITSAIFSLFIIFDLVAIIGGYAIVWSITYLPMGNFLGQIGKAITMADIIIGLIKALCFGITITVISLYYGLKTGMKMTNIPIKTSKSAIDCLVYCLFINILISSIYYIWN